jgi:curved DNA-binding protein CbpA
MSGALKRVAKPRTLYDILGVSRLAKSEDIRSAYLGLAKKYHPDSADSVLVESDDKFREIQEAYATLSNDWKRTLYDQDLQFQTAMSFTESSDSSVPAWRENFNLETPEARIARRERYMRYAAGERNDQPPVQLTTKGSLLGLLLGGVALTYTCAKAPEWFGGQGELTHHDPVTDDHSVGLVLAFYNPIARTWERLGSNQSPPSPRELMEQYRKFSPQLVDRWQYEEKKEGNNVEALEALTVIRVPKTRTVPATVFRSDNQVSINRRTLSDNISRFISPIGM